MNKKAHTMRKKEQKRYLVFQSPDLSKKAGEPRYFVLHGKTCRLLDNGNGKGYQTKELAEQHFQQTEIYKQLLVDEWYMCD